ncbi:MAG: hypothetical protein K8R21_16270 [Leptospira sp.]|nr:hypothetical protein [Leptospira sp.]
MNITMAVSSINLDMDINPKYLVQKLDFPILQDLVIIPQEAGTNLIPEAAMTNEIIDEIYSEAFVQEILQAKSRMDRGEFSTFEEVFSDDE